MDVRHLYIARVRESIIFRSVIQTNSQNPSNRISDVNVALLLETID